MKLLLSGFALAAVTAALAGPAQAQRYPWCAQYGGNGLGGSTNCGLISFPQCMDTITGTGSGAWAAFAS